MYHDIERILGSVAGTLKVTKKNVRVTERKTLSRSVAFELAETVAFAGTEDTKEAAAWLLRESARALGIYPASIHGLYKAFGRKKVKGFTVPAINIRGFTFDTASVIFKLMKRRKAGACIFELARSEMGYTYQPPREYSSWILAAAIATGYEGPVFIQGDHFQFKAAQLAGNKAGEMKKLRELISDAVEWGFYNIDIDSSTLVDLSKKTVAAQQRLNAEVTAAIAKHVRKCQPKGVTVSVGGEIGEVGHKNSTVEELRAYMDRTNKLLNKNRLTGLSKISVQTGTSHGGVVLPDGSIAKVAIDFATLKKLSTVAQTEYGMGGAVQHGASTLPDEVFGEFPKHKTVEVHLATAFQNTIMDHPSFPKKLLKAMYGFIDSELAAEKKKADSKQQSYYKLRKKVWGRFKREVLDLPAEIKRNLRGALEKQLGLMFKKLKADNTTRFVKEYVKGKPAPMPIPGALKKAL